MENVPNTADADDHDPNTAAADLHDDLGYIVEVEEEPDQNTDDQARPKRRQKKIDYATFHRLGKK